MFEDTRESPVETGLFYCNSRYYNPEWCRWISPDDIEYLDPESVNGLNLYCYCLNNPIMYVDPDGHMTEWVEQLVNFARNAVIVIVGINNISKYMSNPIQMITNSINSKMIITQLVTDGITIGITAGATYAIYLICNWAGIGIKEGWKWLKEKSKNKEHKQSGEVIIKEGLKNCDPAQILNFGGTLGKQCDDGDESWDIFKYPY